MTQTSEPIKGFEVVQPCEQPADSTTKPKTAVVSSNKQERKQFIKGLPKNKQPIFDIELFMPNSGEYKYIVSNNDKHIKLTKKQLFKFVAECKTKLKEHPKFKIDEKSYKILLGKDYVEQDARSAKIPLLLVKEFSLTDYSLTLYEFFIMFEVNDKSSPRFLEFKPSYIRFASKLDFYKNLSKFYENEKIKPMDFITMDFMKQLCEKNDIRFCMDVTNDSEIVTRRQVLNEIARRDSAYTKIHDGWFIIWASSTVIMVVSLLVILCEYYNYRQDHLKEVANFKSQLDMEHSKVISLASNFSNYKSSHICENNDIKCSLGQISTTIFGSKDEPNFLNKLLIPVQILFICLVLRVIIDNYRRRFQNKTEWILLGTAIMFLVVNIAAISANGG